jgi:hypothetical protein
MGGGRVAGSQPQSRESAKRFSSRWNWDSPTPLAAGECAPPPFGTGGRAHSLAAKGVGRVPIPTRGHTLWCSIYVSTLWSQPMSTDVHRSLNKLWKSNSLFNLWI